ncbi:hypothetical protein FN846DRAFT_71528 [Sphaerosporella brunnea]|uniref:Uncharacterized protein n=1 Tax=Sphaerosporella brunnea TaxID=1250544 RepID=A0A5J5ETY6_9PEZI|nr:hypothetical protein FN846DRAFT_71528 [Sphaerosporella brunnea]
MFTVADYSESSRRTQPRKRLRRMRECQYRSLGCNAVLNRHAIKLHVSECDYQPPAKMPKPTLDSFTQLIGHCKKHLGFQIVQVLKDWANLTMPAVHTELSVVPDVPVYVDSNRLWDKPLPPHPQVLEDIRAQLYRDEPLFQEENAILLGQMVDGSMHRPAEALRGSLDLKPTRNILSQYGFTLPPELAEIGVKKSLFDVILCTYRFTGIQ